jgi:ABC-type antimicrobial peptide transport system permease subunit
VARIDPTLPLANLTTLEQQARDNVFLDRLVTALSASLAGLATLLAAVGLYGVLAYNVAQRARELGLRLALGAAPTQLQGMVLKRVAVMAVVGGGIGLLAAIAIGGVVESLLYGVSGRDPLVLTIAMVILALVVLGAGYLPARRASRLDPIEALRHD